MKLEIVPFDVAKDLKDLGFSWRTRQCYSQLTDWLSEVDSDVNKHLLKAPEQSLVVKWFRDVHNIHIEIWFSKERRLKGLNLDINKPWGVGWDKHEFATTMLEDISYYSTFEEAELEGIKKTIQYLKDEMAKSTTTS